jgi:magnesium chelatase subunit H
MAVTDAPVKFETGISPGGMFTSSSPESRRVIPTNLDGKTRFKVVYVVLESQYQSSLTKACNTINDGKEGVAIEAVGYLLEELRDPATLAKFKEDVASANIFIGSLIFVQELADKVSTKNKLVDISNANNDESIFRLLKSWPLRETG